MKTGPTDKPKVRSAEKKLAAKPKVKPDDFLSVARRLKCDEDKARFEKKLGKIATALPKAASKRK